MSAAREAILASIRENLSAARSELARDGEPDPGAAAGDHGDLILEEPGGE